MKHRTYCLSKLNGIKHRGQFLQDTVLRAKLQGLGIPYDLMEVNRRELGVENKRRNRTRMHAFNRAVCQYNFDGVDSRQLELDSTINVYWSIAVLGSCHIIVYLLKPFVSAWA